MQHRPLGRSGLSVAPLVFGGNVFGWTADKATSFALLDRFVERGFNAIDTADTYSQWAEGNQGGESEAIIGEWLAARGRRDDVVVMTKVAKWAKRPGLSPANIAAAVDDSLRRLQTDHVDVYFAHEDDQTVPLEDSLGAFARLVEAGKVRALGASNYGAPRLKEALAVSADRGLPRYEVLQPHYNLYERDKYEGPLADLAIAEGLGVVGYFSLASGFLTGKYKSLEDIEGRERARFMKGYFDDRGQAILAALDRVATGAGATPAQVALAWLIHRPGVTAPIVSATSLAQLDDVLKAAELALSADAIATLDQASAW